MKSGKYNFSKITKDDDKRVFVSVPIDAVIFNQIEVVIG